METICIVAICSAGVSLLLSALAWWRAEGRDEDRSLRQELTGELEALRERQRATAAELSLRVRLGYEESLARIERAEKRLAQLRELTSSDVQTSIDALRNSLAAARGEIEAALVRLKNEVSARTEAAELALRRRILRMEGHGQLLFARAEMSHAARRAERLDFAGAVELLENAGTKINEVKLRLSDTFEDDPAFNDVLAALHDATASVRSQAAEHKDELDRALSTSDELLRTVSAREQPLH